MSSERCWKKVRDSVTQHQSKNIEDGHSSNEGFTIIPSCNTRFAKVKFRLKMTQLEIIFNSCPEGKIFRVNCPGAKNLGGNCPGGDSWGKMFGG